MPGSHTIERTSATLVLVDLQERLVCAMSRREEVLANVRFLAEAAALLGMPVIVTRQYPQGLGDIVAEIADLPASIQPVDKLTFDCMGEPEFRHRIEALGRRQIVLAGMETHICVAQTALGLLDAGYQPFGVADAVCSRLDRDHEVAIERLRSAGVIVTTAEAVVYEALGHAATPEFRAILPLVKARADVGVFDAGS